MSRTANASPVGFRRSQVPTLVGWVDDERSHCCSKKEPETPQELEQAIGVLDVQELGCHRYNGHDPAILKRVAVDIL